MKPMSAESIMKNNGAPSGARSQSDAEKVKMNNPTFRLSNNFDFDWKFFKGDIPGAEQPDFSDTEWRSLDLPHDWSIEGPIREEPAGTGNISKSPGLTGITKLLLNSTACTRTAKSGLTGDTWGNGPTATSVFITTSPRI
jgi:hypothetical protein